MIGCKEIVILENIYQRLVSIPLGLFRFLVESNIEKRLIISLSSNFLDFETIWKGNFETGLNFWFLFIYSQVDASNILFRVERGFCLANFLMTLFFLRFFVKQMLKLDKRGSLFLFRWLMIRFEAVADRMSWGGDSFREYRDL